MTPHDALQECRDRGILLEWSGKDTLHVEAPEGTMGPELRAALKRYKYTILTIIRTVRTLPTDDPPGVMVSPTGNGRRREGCYCCGGKDFWQRDGGSPVCVVCHPDPGQGPDRSPAPAASNQTD